MWEHESVSVSRVIRLPRKDIRVAAATALGGALLSVASIIPAPAMVIVCAFALLIYAFGWSRLLGAPSPITNSVVIFAAAVAGMVVEIVNTDVYWLVLILGALLPVAFLAEIFRGANRQQVVYSLMVSISGALVAIAGCSWVALGDNPVWKLTGLPLGLALAAGALFSLLTRVPAIRMALTFIGAMVAGIVLSNAIGITGYVQLDGWTRRFGFSLADSHSSALVFSAVCALLAAVILVVSDSVFTPRRHTDGQVDGGEDARGWWAALSQGVLPLLLGGISAYAVVRALSAGIPGIS